MINKRLKKHEHLMALIRTIGVAVVVGIQTLLILVALSVLPSTGKAATPIPNKSEMNIKMCTFQVYFVTHEGQSVYTIVRAMYAHHAVAQVEASGVAAKVTGVERIFCEV